MIPDDADECEFPIPCPSPTKFYHIKENLLIAIAFVNFWHVLLTHGVEKMCSLDDMNTQISFVSADTEDEL